MDTTPAVRLKEFLEYKKISFNEFTRLINANSLIGSSNKYVGEGEKSIIGPKHSVKFSASGLNYEWYLTGEGEMLVQKKSARGVSDFDISKAEGVAFVALPEINKMTIEEIEQKYAELENVIQYAARLKRIIDSNKAE